MVEMVLGFVILYAYLGKIPLSILGIFLLWGVYQHPIYAVIFKSILIEELDGNLVLWHRVLIALVYIHTESSK